MTYSDSPQVKENNDAIATMDRKVAALCEDISNANDELDDMDHDSDDDAEAPLAAAAAQPRQVSPRPQPPSPARSVFVDGQVRRSGP